MLYLLLCVLANVGIFICFRQFRTYGLNTFQAIVFNYITCVATGLVFFGNSSGWSSVSFQEEWVWFAAFLGIIFIVAFNLMAITTQRFSMTVSSIAAKMSLIIPVLVSLFFLQIQSKEYSVLNYFGMATAVPAIVMSSLKKSLQGTRFLGFGLLLPLSVFLLGGFIDASINYANFQYLNQDTEPLFPILIFSSAALIGIAVLFIRRQRISLKNIIGGLALGSINYFSMYFLIRGLTSLQNDGALFYPLLNIGIILISALISTIIFREKLNLINRIGLLLAILSIGLISYQELIGIQ